MQPPRTELREFYRHAEERLGFPTIWFNDAKRQAIGEAFARVIDAHRYTVWGCAVLRNHAHLCVRRHRDGARTIWTHFAESARDALRSLNDVADDHPIWSNRPYGVFLYSPQDVHRVLTYIADNPTKEGLSRQTWSFVKRYDNWPLRGKSRL